MNCAILKGSLVRDVEIRYTTDNRAIARFTLAVRREMPNSKGEYESDFINCVAFSKLADVLAKYTGKGSKILVEGRIQTGNYEGKDGKKVYTTDVIVSKFEFLDKKENKEEHIEQQTDPYEEMGNKVESDVSLPF